MGECVIMVKQISDKGGLYIGDKIVGLSISQLLPCTFAICNL